MYNTVLFKKNTYNFYLRINFQCLELFSLLKNTINNNLCLVSHILLFQKKINKFLVRFRFRFIKLQLEENRRK